MRELAFFALILPLAALIAVEEEEVSKININSGEVFLDRVERSASKRYCFCTIDGGERECFSTRNVDRKKYKRCSGISHYKRLGWKKPMPIKQLKSSKNTNKRHVVRKSGSKRNNKPASYRKPSGKRSQQVKSYNSGKTRSNGRTSSTQKRKSGQRNRGSGRVRKPYNKKKHTDVADIDKMQADAPAPAPATRSQPGRLQKRPSGSTYRTNGRSGNRRHRKGRKDYRVGKPAKSPKTPKISKPVKPQMQGDAPAKTTSPSGSVRKPTKPKTTPTKRKSVSRMYCKHSKYGCVRRNGYTKVNKAICDKEARTKIVEKCRGIGLPRNPKRKDDKGKHVQKLKQLQNDAPSSKDKEVSTEYCIEKRKRGLCILTAIMNDVSQEKCDEEAKTKTVLSCEDYRNHKVYKPPKIQQRTTTKRVGKTTAKPRKLIPKQDRKENNGKRKYQKDDPNPGTDGETTEVEGSGESSGDGDGGDGSGDGEGSGDDDDDDDDDDSSESCPNADEIWKDGKCEKCKDDGVNDGYNTCISQDGFCDLIHRGRKVCVVLNDLSSCFALQTNQQMFNSIDYVKLGSAAYTTWVRHKDDTLGDFLSGLDSAKKSVKEAGNRITMDHLHEAAKYFLKTEGDCDYVKRIIFNIDALEGCQFTEGECFS